MGRHDEHRARRWTAQGWLGVVAVGLLVVALQTFGCEGAVARVQDAADATELIDARTTSDVSPTDADAGDATDSGELAIDDVSFEDAGEDAGDATSLGDAVDDGADTSWGACTADGRAGACVEIAECDAGRVSTPGHCPGPAAIQCCTQPPVAGSCDPAVQVIPVVDLVEDVGDPGCLDDMVRIGTFCVDRYEAVLVQVYDDGSEAPWSPYHNPGSIRVRALSVANAVPQGYIDGTQAEAACLEAGKRLCSDTEWLRACQGSATTTYPYGDSRVDGLCNDGRAVHPVVEFFGTTADWIWSQLGNACINQLADTLAATGAHRECVSEAGAYDMMGNLHEWTADPNGTFRGGFYVDTTRNGEGCLYRTTAHNRYHWDYSTGFRCCAAAR